MTPLRRTLLRLYAAIFRDPLFVEFYDGAGYANYGYWHDDETSGKAASDALMDRLVEPVAHARGRVLDVACGQGGTTARLGHWFGPERVTAVNFQRSQIEAARCNAPGSHYAVMDAAQLAFAPESFGVACCVEAAFHFETREDFLRRTFEALQPNGTLLLADVIVRARLGRIPRENDLPDADAFVALLEGIGFRDVVVEDVRERSWKTFKRRYLAFVLRRLSRPSMLRYVPYLGWATTRFLLNDYAIRSYLLIRAQKP